MLPDASPVITNTKHKPTVRIASSRSPNLGPSASPGHKNSPRPFSLDSHHHNHAPSPKPEDDRNQADMAVLVDKMVILEENERKNRDKIMMLESTEKSYRDRIAALEGLVALQNQRLDALELHIGKPASIPAVADSVVPSA